MANTKGEIVNNALRRIKISGLTSKPGAEEIQEGVAELESMMHELKSRNVCTSYNYEESPSPNTNANIKNEFLVAIQTNLAMRLADYYGKEVSITLAGLARGSISNMSARTSKTNQILPPNRMPKGSGNTVSGHTWNRFYRCKPNAPIDCDTADIVLGDTLDYTLNWDDWLSEGASVISYEIVAESGLLLLADQLQVNEVYFKVTAKVVGSQSVTIKIFSSEQDRTDTRTVHFNVLASKSA